MAYYNEPDRDDRIIELSKIVSTWYPEWKECGLFEVYALAILRGPGRTPGDIYFMKK